LKPYYDKHLRDHLVLETLLDVANYFATICPLCVHTDSRGEWTGFPLRSQPGVHTRLHPAEPPLVYGDADAQQRNADWLNRRRPGGDFRLICGKATDDGRDVLLGITFIGNASFSPFVEATDQVETDIAGGFPYYLCTDGSRLRSRAMGPYRHGDTVQGIVSAVPLDDWLGEPLANVASIGDYSVLLPPDEWRRQIYLNRTDHLVRRAQRMAATFPPM
jgi:hypothetical protein